MLTIASLVAICAVKGDAIAIESDSGSATWREMLNSVANKVEFLARKFPGQAPRQVCYLSENGLELVAWLGAFATLGVTVTGLDHTAEPAALSDALLRLGPAFLLCSEGLREAGLAAEQDALPVLFFNPFTLSGHKESLPPDLGRLKPLPFRAVSVTSGTTGRPKLVLREESFEKRRFAYFSERFRLDGRDRFLACIPLHHAAGNGWIRFFMSLGATVVLTDKSDGAGLADLVCGKGITASVLTPVLLDRIVEGIHRGDHAGRPADLRWILVGGKNFTPRQKRRAVETLGGVHEYFGTTETGVNTLAEPTDLLLHPRSVGRSFSGNDVIIVGGDGKVLKAGQTGAVAVCSYMNMLGYDDAPANEIHVGGKRYLVTPDQGRLDEDGRLYLHNRLSRPDADVDLYGLEDEIRGIASVGDVILHQSRTHDAAEVCCAVVSTESAGAVEYGVRDVLERHGLRLAAFTAVDEIPYSPTGKVRVEFIEKTLISAGVRP
jgi:acyl-coenzyme A synthetase/AMP-(fatty) acid ligase